MCVDVSECYERNGLVCFEQNFLTPDDDGGGLDTTNWGGTTYEHMYSPLEEDCVHFLPNLNREDRMEGPGNLAAGKILDTDKSGYIWLNMFLTLLF